MENFPRYTLYNKLVLKHLDIPQFKLIKDMSDMLYNDLDLTRYVLSLLCIL